MPICYSQCQKHNKSLQILVINQAKYICQDCAIFQSQYRQQQLLQKHSVSLRVMEITKNCDQLLQLQKTNKILTHTNLKSILHSVEDLQDQLINDINRQFSQIKTKLSNTYLINVEEKQQERNENGKGNFSLLMKQTIPQHKLRKQKLFQKDLVQYHVFLNQQTQKINHFHLILKQQLQNNVSCKISLKDFFNKVLVMKVKQKITQTSHLQDENLLDFSEFKIQSPILQPQLAFTDMDQQTFQSVGKFDKKKQVQRMKTASCLEDSVCSIEALSKYNQGVLNNLQIDQSTHYLQSLQSQRSISCASVISAMSKSNLPHITTSSNLVRQPSKKTIIQIKTISQFHSKLLSISPQIKIIKLLNLPITTQQFISMLKQKISSSFIHTLEITSCPKLNEKILLELKIHKCKTLKKIQFQQCKQMNFNDKKTKQMLKKLDLDGIKVGF